MAIVFPLGAALGAFLAVATGPAVVLDRIAAVVGDEIVLASEVDRLATVGFLPRLPSEGAVAYRDRVLDRIVVELLWEREMRLTGGAEPDPKDVTRQVEEIAARAEAATGKPFETVLKEAGTTRSDVTGWVRRGLLVEGFVRERILPTVKITPAEVKAFYEGPFRGEAAAKGLPEVPPLDRVEDAVRELLRERSLNAAIDRWTDGLRERTRILVYRRGGAEGTAAGVVPGAAAVAPAAVPAGDDRR